MRQVTCYLHLRSLKARVDDERLDKSLLPDIAASAPGRAVCRFALLPSYECKDARNGIRSGFGSLQYFTQHLDAAFNAVTRELIWLALAAITIGFAEFRWPAEARSSYAARLGNVLIGVFVVASLTFLSPILGATSEWLRAQGLIGLVFGNWKPAGALGLVASTLVFVFVWDFFQYWFHRAEHTFAILWPVHALHHEEERVNFTTSQRNTIWSAIFGFLFTLLPTLIVCGVDLLSVAGGYVFFNVYGHFNHANVRLHLGRLTPAFSGPQWHRLHHGRDAEYFNKNFAAFFPIYDILFGTYRAPKRDEYPATGLSDRPQAPVRALPMLRAVLGLPAAKAPAAPVVGEGERVHSSNQTISPEN